jgi:UDP-glucose 4-epimerase
MPYITQVAIGKLKELTVFGDDYPTRDGTCIRDYIHVSDLAEGHISALDVIESVKGCIPINLGTGEGYTVLELVHAFERAIGKPLPHKIGPRRPGDSAATFADPSLALELLGWKAKRGIDEICNDAWNWQSKNPNGYQTR